MRSYARGLKSTFVVATLGITTDAPGCPHVVELFGTGVLAAAGVARSR